jgi:hypothetical protein
MPDDIVTRLHKSCYCSPTAPLDHSCLAFAAADEIERLRHEMAGVRRYFLQMEAALSDIEHLTSDRNVLHRIKEARRGS